MLMRFGADANRVPNTEKNTISVARSHAMPGMRRLVSAMMHCQPENVFFRQFVALKFSDDRTVSHDIRPVTHSDDFRKFRTDHQHRRTLGHNAIEKTEDFCLGTDVDAARRFIEYEKAGACIQPLSDYDLLL